MKKILFLLVSVLLFASCGKKTEPWKLKTDATITIKAGTSTRAHVSGKTALEIVQETANMNISSYRFGNQVYDEVKTALYGFAEHQIDYETPALKMLPVDIVTVNGELELQFIESFDVFFTDNNGDTIAYIPNQMITDAKIAILNAYEQEDFEAVYALFENAYKFYPMPEE